MTDSPSVFNIMLSSSSLVWMVSFSGNFGIIDTFFLAPQESEKEMGALFRKSGTYCWGWWCGELKMLQMLMWPNSLTLLVATDSCPATNIYFQSIWNAGRIRPWQLSLLTAKATIKGRYFLLLLLVPFSLSRSWHESNRRRYFLSLYSHYTQWS